MDTYIARTSVKYIIVFLAFCFSFRIHAQKQIIPIETKENALVLKVGTNKDVNMIYYGKKIGNPEEYIFLSDFNLQRGDYTGIINSAYTPSGSRNLVEPAISVEHYDGNLSLDLKYQSHTTKKIDTGISLTEIVLKDPVYEFEVKLYYKAFYDFNIIEQWSVIKHSEKKEVTLKKFASANLYLNDNSFWLKQFHGDWAKEMQSEETQLTHGIKTLDSKLGTRTNLFQPPVFMVSMNKPSEEDNGTVLFGALEWSGNFRFDLEIDPLDNLRIIAGTNNYASEYKLAPNKEFKTPGFITILSHNGKGDASRKMHSWAKKYKIVDGEGSRLTLLNNWESTYFDFNEDKLAELIKDTKKLGADLFLLDDGWFGNKYPRNNDRAGLGDWQENKIKLPNGITRLVKEAHNNQVKFGIWLEPEMVNPKSELYEKHPDWVIKQPERPEYYFRNQLVLDLSNPEVQNFVFETVDNILTKNPELAFIKWDCNAVIYNANSQYLHNQSHLYINYVNGLYDVLQRLRAKHPTLPMMLCSGGGGRVDYGALQYFTEYWPSDNTDPLERIFMQWEYSYFYPSITSCNHVTNWGKQPLKFRVDIAMMGKLGFDIVVSDLSEKDLEFCQNALVIYDSIKNIIWHGDQYRLTNPTGNNVASMMFVNEKMTKSIVFNYSVNNRYGATGKTLIKLKGLDPNKKYSIKEINIYPGVNSQVDPNKVYGGDFLMNIGFNPDVNAWRTSVILQIEEIPD